ncbi:SAM-dependent methyltransferase, partial [Streptomyces sp. SID625]|nr:SAM-dependent methyltransferase [Streptomyces sp. SID625]
MNRAQISRLAHAGHPIAAPLDDESVRLLLDGLLPREEARVLDLGCGGAEWLLRALAMRPLLRAEGVDVAAEA